jgi:hypothetical protein
MHTKNKKLMQNQKNSVYYRSTCNKHIKKIVNQGNKLFNLSLEPLKVKFDLDKGDKFFAKLKLHEDYKNITFHTSLSGVKNNLNLFKTEILYHELAHYFDIFLCPKLPVKQIHSMRFKKILSKLKNLLREEAKKQKEEGTQKILNKVGELAIQLEDLYLTLAKKEEEVKNLTKEIDELESKKIPDIMEEAGISGVTLPGGKKINVQEKWFISCKKDQQDALYEWFIMSGYAEYVTKTVQIPIDNVEQFDEIQSKCEEFDVSLISKLPHPKTVEKFFRERIADNDQIPTDLLNSYQKKVTKITN